MQQTRPRSPAVGTRALGAKGPTAAAVERDDGQRLDKQETKSASDALEVLAPEKAGLPGILSGGQLVPVPPGMQARVDNSPPVSCNEANGAADVPAERPVAAVPAGYLSGVQRRLRVLTPIGKFAGDTASAPIRKLQAKGGAAAFFPARAGARVKFFGVGESVGAPPSSDPPPPPEDASPFHLISDGLPPGAVGKSGHTTPRTSRIRICISFCAGQMRAREDLCKIICSRCHTMFRASRMPRPQHWTPG